MSSSQLRWYSFGTFAVAILVVPLVTVVVHRYYGEVLSSTAAGILGLVAGLCSVMLFRAVLLAAFPKLEQALTKVDLQSARALFEAYREPDGAYFQTRSFYPSGSLSPFVAATILCAALGAAILLPSAYIDGGLGWSVAAGVSTVAAVLIVRRFAGQKSHDIQHGFRLYADHIILLPENRQLLFTDISAICVSISGSSRSMDAVTQVVITAKDGNSVTCRWVNGANGIPVEVWKPIQYRKEDSLTDFLQTLGFALKYDDPLHTAARLEPPASTPLRSAE